MSELARKTGRGFLVITGAKVWFLLSSAVVNLGLPIIFDKNTDQGAAAFGAYGLVTNLVSIFNMVLLTGTLQAVSKVVSEVPERAPVLVRRALLNQLWIGVPIAAVYLLSANIMAGWLGDPTLTPLVQLSTGVILMYSFYAIFVGYFNGKREYTRQAALDIGFSTLKTVLILTAVFLGFSVMGSIAGFVATAVVMTIVSAVWVVKRMRKAASEPQPAAAGPASSEAKQGRVLKYMIVLLAFTFFINGILRADLFLLQAISADQLTQAGLSVDQVAAGSKTLSGVYTGMANIARLPYQAVIAITFVIFPLISKSTFEGDRQATQLYVRQTLRYSLLLIAGMAVVLIACREPLLKALYPDEYGSGEEALVWLALGMVAFALSFVATTILNSAGRPLYALALAAGSFLAACVLNYVLLSATTTQGELLAQAGLATMIATAAGMVGALVVLYRLYQAGIPWATGLRCAVIGVAIVLVGPLVPIEALGDMLGGGRMVSLGAVGLKMGVLGIAFLGLMLVARELGPRDIERFKSVLRRRKPAAAESPS